MIPTRLLLCCAPVLFAATACVSYPPTGSSGSKAGAGSAVEAWSLKAFDTQNVRIWSVEGAWTSVEAASGYLQQATDAGPSRVLVRLRNDARQYAYTVRAGAIVGGWTGGLLMIDNSGSADPNAPGWVGTKSPR